MARKWLPYEINQLIKYRFSIDNLDQYGEKPVEYITGHAAFGGLDFLVTPNTLIPRIETEEMIDLALEFLGQPFRLSKVRIADVATGCGCLGVALAARLSQMKIEATKNLSVNKRLSGASLLPSKIRLS